MWPSWAVQGELAEGGSCWVLTVSSCFMYSMVASRALVPRVASSSTAFTVLRREVTLVTITCMGEINREFLTLPISDQMA